MRRHQWFFILSTTLILLLNLFTAVECKKKPEEWTEKEKADWIEFTEKHGFTPEKGAMYVWAGVLGVSLFSAIINMIIFILVCKGVCCKPAKKEEINQTLDVL